MNVLTTLTCPSFHRRRHTFKYTFEAANFLAWRRNEVGKITVIKQLNGRKSRAVRNIPIGYIQLVDQLVKESLHGQEGGQESVRRSAYADITLDAFARELFAKAVAGPKFRSKVLTPLMQRHRSGIPDHYTPVLRRSLGGETATHATLFYLSEDPINPKYLSQYRRSLIYLPESRWHLGLLLGTIELKNQDHYNIVWQNHDRVMTALRDGNRDDEGESDESESDESESEDSDSDSSQAVDEQVREVKVHAFSKVEVEVILQERLQDFFKVELARVAIPPKQMEASPPPPEQMETSPEQTEAPPHPPEQMEAPSSPPPPSKQTEAPPHPPEQMEAPPSSPPPPSKQVEVSPPPEQMEAPPPNQEILKRRNADDADEESDPAPRAKRSRSRRVDSEERDEE